MRRQEIYMKLIIIYISPRSYDNAEKYSENQTIMYTPSSNIDIINEEMYIVLFS